MFQKTRVMMVVAMLGALVPVAFADNTSLPQPQQSVQVLNRIIARVNDKAVTQEEFDQFYDRTVAQLRDVHQDIPPESQLRPSLFHQYINRVILLQMADRFDIKATDKQIDEQIKRIAEQQKMTLPQLKQMVKGQGYTYPEFRQEVAEEIKIGTLQRQAVSAKVHVSQADIDKTYQSVIKDPKYAAEYHVVDILLPLPEKPSKQQLQSAHTKAYKLISQLRAGKTFKQVDDKEGTDLGWRPLADLPSIFERPVEKLKVGGVVGPIEADNGLHVVQLLGIRKSKEPLPTKDQVERFLFEKEFQKQSVKWVNKIRNTSDVQILVPQQ